MRFGSTAKVLLKCKLKYYRISECTCACTLCEWKEGGGGGGVDFLDSVGVAFIRKATPKEAGRTRVMLQRKTEQ